MTDDELERIRRAVNQGYADDRSAARALLAEVDRLRRNAGATPTVCLVGSSRFRQEFVRQAYRLETSGHLVLCMAFFQHADHLEVSEEQRAVLEVVDRARIDLCHWVLVIDARALACKACGRPLHRGFVSGKILRHPHLVVSECCRSESEFVNYVGESTRKEIEYALSVGKPVKYLSEERP